MHVRRPVPLGFVAAAFLGLSPGLLAAGARPFFGEAGPAAERSASVLAAPAGAPCAGLSNTTNDPDVANRAGSAGIFIQRFVPPTTPFLPTAVCVATFSGIATPEPYDVVVFSDAGGAPGTLLAAVPAVPAAPGAFPGQWARTPLDGVSPVYGPIWAGVRITTGFDMNLDFEAVAAPVAQAISMDGGQTWTPADGATAASVVLAGGAAGAAVPVLPGPGLVVLLLALAATGFHVIRQG